MMNIDDLYAHLDARKDASPEVSYTARLLARGLARIAQKVGEEAVETVIEAMKGDRTRLISESADLVYHLTVLWLSQGITPADIWRELDLRTATAAPVAAPTPITAAGTLDSATVPDTEFPRMITDLVIASHNPGKVREIADLLLPFGFRVLSAADRNLPEPEETGDTFVANARLKALAAAEASGLPALADDSGLCVVALDGAPGIYSARWAGSDKDFSRAMQRVQLALDATGNPDRRAFFVCVLALAWPDGQCQVFEGRCDGQLVWPPRGDNGFGYDPVFVPDGHTITFGEMDPIRKHAMSHRARAFAEFMIFCSPPDTL
jgi:XTP/dITP diphosphohydrolase